ncbi:probable ubiquitin-like-specific protease 2A [Henckelia pumila]|uniref:probable ubiquitin-like-specific protease 2A n=1 Tax=Henckelia pumila TaxID=405737 RepID=UPI003C6E6BE1
MRKTRNVKPLSAVESRGKTTGRGDQGGGSSKNKFSVFEFAEDDERVEVDSHRTLSKFENKTRSRKHDHHHPVDKYHFLSFFTRGNTTSQHDSRKKSSAVDVSDDSLKDETFTSDVSVLHDSSNCRWRPLYSQNHHDSELFSGEENSFRYGKGSGKKHNKVLCGNSDDGEMKSTIYFDLAANGGSVEELSSDHVTNVNDCEAVVVIAPNYVKYRSKSYTKCHLTFSQRCIKLNGSLLCEEKNPHCLEWSIDDIMKIEYHPRESVEADFVNLQLKSRDENVSGAYNFDSDAEMVELEFVLLGNSQWSKKMEEIKSLDPKYEAAWETIAHVNSSDVTFEDIIYPKGDPDAVCISKKDVDLLQPRTFINDTVIDFYIKYLLNRMASVERHKFHAFNAFFFRKLADLDQDPSRARDGKKAFQRVQKWTRNVNLFEKDYVLIPVNFSFHWSLIVICHPGKVANFKAKDMDNSSEMTCILHMDSLRGIHIGFENLIQSYLLEEWKERHKELEADVSVKFLNLPFVVLQVPQQENFFDCGLFLLHYAEQFLQLATNFSTRKYADWLNENLFLPAEVSLKKRYHIRNLIYRLVGDDVGEDPSAVCSNICLPVDNVNKEDNSAEFVKETIVKDVCCGKTYDSNVDQQIHMTYTSTGGQQPFVGMLEPSDFAKSASDECCQLFEPLLSIKDEAHEKPTTFRPPFAASLREADGNSVSLPSPYSVRRFNKSEMDVQFEIGSTSAVASIIIEAHNGENTFLEVKSSADNEKNESDCSSPSSEVLAACVADSEEENETQRFRRRH